MSIGAELIAEERQRQLQVEGWTPEHDAQYSNYELVAAAREYLNIEVGAEEPPSKHWPWDEEWWKPSNNHVRNLTKAGALIAAEIDRVRAIDND
jgi:hypothetical protein